jgi:hypothetical protein
MVPPPAQTMPRVRDGRISRRSGALAVAAALLILLAALVAISFGAPPLAARASQPASLNVANGNGGNGNGSGNNSNSGNNSLGSLIPSGFLTIGLILVLVYMGAIIAIAVGVVALAVLVPRRLRQLSETLANAGLPPKESKPPT